MKAKPLPPLTPAIAARFWSKVNVGLAHECWNWKAFVHPAGYGYFQMGRGRTAYAHRVSYLFYVGPVPDGMTLDHLCRNRACVNPTHLEVVSNKVNALRGDSFSAENARKTHCKAGHPLSGENLYLKHRPNGTVSRICLTCRRAHQRVLNRKYRDPGYKPSSKPNPS